MAITKASGSNYLSCASDTFFCRNRDFTVMLWCRPTEDPGSNGQYQSIIGCWDSGVSNGWSLAWNGDLVFNFGWAVSGAYSSYPVSGTALAMSTWYHVAVSYQASSGVWEQFVNGIQTRLVDETSTIPNATATLRIGQDPDNPIGLAGQLAYVRIFEGYLSQAEVQAEMGSPIPVNRRFPCSLDMPLDTPGSSSVLAPDRSYTGHHATSLTGTVAWGMGPPAVAPLAVPPTKRRRVELFVTSGAASTTAPAEAATAAGTAHDATVVITTNATEATGTGTAHDPSATVSPNATEATATGTADDATASVVTVVADAAATASALDPNISITATADAASATGTAHDATVVVGTIATAEAATATGAAHDPTVTVLASSEPATATGTAADATSSVTASPATADASGTAQDVIAAVVVNSETAAATGSALDATVTASGGTVAAAQAAEATAIALDATVTVVIPAGLATASGTADDASTSVQPLAGTATGTGAAVDAAVSIVVNAITAEATAEAFNPSTSGGVQRDITFTTGQVETGWSTGELATGWTTGRLESGWSTGRLEV